MKKSIKETILSKKRGKAEIAALILYIIGTAVISYFHEPWFDESQAWLIAKSASVKDIIFRVQHYEVHSPLWHLILAPFAKLGAPFELTISVINIVFCSAAVALLLFKSPFPKIVRCLIPFSYFFFYQYGVIARPYSVMMLAFMLLALTYKKRNEKPLPYVLSLALLCLSHLHGMVIAGGLAIVWVVEIFARYKKAGNFIGVFKEKSCYALLGLAMLAGFLICIMIPAEDIYYASIDDPLSTRLYSIANLLLFPANATFSSYFEYTSLDITGLIIDMILGALVLVPIIYVCYKNKKLSMFLLPYTLYGTISIFYYSLHHIGIFAVFIVFIFWTICEDPCADYTKLREKAAYINSKVTSKLLRGIAVCAFVLVASIPVIQSVTSACLEIKYTFGYGRALASFLKETGLSERKILVDWVYSYDLSEEERKGAQNLNKASYDLTVYDHTDKRHDYTCMINHNIVLAYIDENIFMNNQRDGETVLYHDYRRNTREESEADLKKWHDMGLPEVIIGRSSLDMIFSEEELTYRYVRVAKFEYAFIFKYFHKQNSYAEVFVREDLLDEYPELHEIKD